MMDAGRRLRGEPLARLGDEPPTEREIRAWSFFFGFAAGGLLVWGVLYVARAVG